MRVLIAIMIIKVSSNRIHSLLLEQLRDKLIELGVVVAEEEIEYEWDDGLPDHVASEPVISYHPHTGTYPMVQVQAFFQLGWIRRRPQLRCSQPCTM